MNIRDFLLILLQLYFCRLQAYLLIQHSFSNESPSFFYLYFYLIFLFISADCSITLLYFPLSYTFFYFIIFSTLLYSFLLVYHFFPPVETVTGIVLSHNPLLHPARCPHKQKYTDELSPVHLCIHNHLLILVIFNHSLNICYTDFKRFLSICKLFCNFVINIFNY